jgi:gliding motility-associated-like protein
MWSPTYETTSTINSLKSGGVITEYEVEVTNTMDGLRCSNRDDIIIDVAPKPIPNFSFKNLPFVEGCEPFHIEIDNKTIGAIEHYWVFGDGHKSNEVNPQHTYYAGSYNFAYYAISDRGCIDSIKYDNFVNVYSSPHPRFTWEPEIPTVRYPVIQFHNLTMPHNSDNIYYWKIQYDKDINNSVTTLKEYEPSYIFKSFDNSPISGHYNVELISLTQNLAPSGNYILCSDTINNKILLINDFLQFPNVVTPNNDGINDIFEIKNLITEIGFQENELYIYNRWGKLVYHINNITTVEDFWNPATTNSPDGTYFYRFTAKGYTGDIQHNGVIEVLR